MATDCIPQVTFEGEGFPKPVIARFDLPEASSDGGLVLLKALDSQLGLTARLAACLDDGRQAGKVLHEAIELVQQQVFGLCAGSTTEPSEQHQWARPWQQPFPCGADQAETMRTALCRPSRTQQR